MSQNPSCHCSCHPFHAEIKPLFLWNLQPALPVVLGINYFIFVLSVLNKQVKEHPLHLSRIAGFFTVLQHFTAPNHSHIFLEIRFFFFIPSSIVHVIYNRCLKTDKITHEERQNECFSSHRSDSSLCLLAKLSVTLTSERQKKEMYNYCHLFLYSSPIMLLPKTTYNVLCTHTLNFTFQRGRGWKKGGGKGVGGGLGDTSLKIN